MPTYTPGLEWPRSDGDESFWPKPEELLPSTTNNYWKKCEYPNDKIDLYETKVGKVVADFKGIRAASYRIKLPPGYALFEHHKQQAGGGERVDVYLRGCSHIGKKQFRSPNEFSLHAQWLLDTKRPLDNHATCQCIYNTTSEAAKAKKAGPSTSTTRKAEGSQTSPKKRQKKEVAEVEEELPNGSAIIPERSIDLKTLRRYRKGELVWFKIPTINAPPQLPPSTSTSPATPTNRNLPSITHWPGLIAKIITRPQNAPNGPAVANASISALWSIAGGEPPEALRPGREKYTFEYHIRPLGLFSSSSEVVERTEDMLPWAMGKELLGGVKGWEMIGKEGTRVLKDGVEKEINEEKGKDVVLPTDEAGWDARWRQHWGQRWSFKDRPQGWDTAVFRLSIGLKIAHVISNCWTQTDKVDIVPGADINPDDLTAIQQQRKSLYQGLWWGGERLWLEDILRLKMERANLPEESLGKPSEGSADRAVLFKTRMITLETSPESTPDNHSWRCLLYGDVFEVVEGSSDRPATWVVSQDGTEESITLTHPAPKGYSYKQLNETSAEVTVDIMDVAGRVYPDLLDPTTQRWFTSPLLSPETNKTRFAPGDCAMALTGLKPGSTVESKSDKWKEDLYAIVNDANKTVERQTKNYYKRLVNPSTTVHSTASSSGNNGAANSQASNGTAATGSQFDVVMADGSTVAASQ